MMAAQAVIILGLSIGSHADIYRTTGPGKRPRTINYQEISDLLTTTSCHG